MNRSFALEEYHSRYSYQKYIRNFRSYFISYITYERADEPVSGFGFNIFKFEIVYKNDSEHEKYIRYFWKRIIIREIII